MFVTINQLSHELNLPAAWLRTEAKAGRIPSLKVGRRLLFDPEQVMRVLSERAQDATADNTTVDESLAAVARAKNTGNPE